ncbi:hypothetical protein PENANT_c002G07969 [Penicillium antarcticum]|uniref:Amine oxidase domain-containing protein n=1 Tax=Penicillium antarcticum TaxID=416450 RepID=A0A1V6QKS5_9EURO|nr:hypothetical protein PENANT_c002G07969 [Penicillium antarcticum]
MAHKQKPTQPNLRDPAHSGSFNAWLLGSSIASLASAIHLIRDSNVPAACIHLVESRRDSGADLAVVGDPKSGYDHRAACMPILSDTCIKEIFTSVPSTTDSGKTVMDNIEKAKKGQAPTCLFIQGGHDLEMIDNSKFSVGLKVRAQLVVFMMKPEKSLNIIGPLTRFLQNQGVDFRFNSKVTDMTVDSGQDNGAVSGFKFIQNGSESIVSVSPRDIIIMSPGSVMSGSTGGTNSMPPSLELLDVEDKLDENWSLWLGVSPNLGDPYNFCTRISESRLESFTITIKDIGFSSLLQVLTHSKGSSSSLVSLRHSNWFLCLYIPHQPFFPHQPNDVQVLWGYGSFPEREGNFVRKPMLRCSGREIMIELLQHLDVPLEHPILNNSITIPRLMPRLTAPLLSRNYSDRPGIISESMANLAVVGQFVEMPDESCATMDYSVRGAQAAVYHLMGLQKEPRKSEQSSIPNILGF